VGNLGRFCRPRTFDGLPLMGDERRKYYRYPVTTGSDTVVVRHHGIERPARLVNLSSDGFRVDLDQQSIEVDEESIVEVGDIVLMATASGFHRVRVVNVARGDGMLQLGLQRLQDLPANAVEKHEEAEGRSRPKRRPKGGVHASFAQILVPAALGVLILGTIVWTWNSQDDPVGTVVGTDGFDTPTSDYGVRRRRASAESGETVPANNDKPKRRTAAGEGRDVAGSTPWIQGNSSNDDDSKTRRGERADDAARSTADVLVARSDAPAGESVPADGAGGGSPSESFGGTTLSFDPRADARANIEVALHTASRENKRVLVEFGGSTCDSCSRLNSAIAKDSEIANAFQKAFVLVLVDIEANQNLVSRYVQDEVRVPFLALLNKQGKVLKRRRTADLQEGSKLDVGKVKEFLQLSAG
jgi:Thioredoxin-like